MTEPGVVQELNTHIATRKLMLVDGHALVHRAFHALPELTTTSGELVNAVFGWTSMVIKAIDTLRRPTQSSPSTGRHPRSAIKSTRSTRQRGHGRRGRCPCNSSACGRLRRHSTCRLSNYPDSKPTTSSGRWRSRPSGKGCRPSSSRAISTRCSSSTITSRSSRMDGNSTTPSSTRCRVLSSGTASRQSRCPISRG